MNKEQYQEKINSKIDYAKTKAEQLKNSSNEFFSKGFCERTGIPMGQPILVGHHSEQRHRNAIKKYDNQISNAIKDNEKAEYYENKAERLENNTSISSDNPEAINLLKEKLIKLEKQREHYKEINKAFRQMEKKGKKPLLDLGLSEDKINQLEESIKKAYSWEKQPYPKWMIGNLGGNIKSVRDRIKYLEQQTNIKEVEETINNVVLKVDKEANRIKLFFDGKPPEETRTILKQNGYRWSPFNSCWQCFLHDWKIEQAREILNKLVVV